MAVKIMKHNKILKIVGVVVSVIVILSLSFGVFFGLLKRNEKTTLSAYAETVAPISTQTTTMLYEVHAPSEAFPITFYGYNGTSKKSTTINNDDECLTVTTTVGDFGNGNYAVVASGSITYFYAVDIYGKVLFIDLNKQYGISFPLYAYMASSTATPVTISITLSYVPAFVEDVYFDGYDYGYNIGYDDGIDDGYDDGFSMGYETGNNNGFNEGYDIGYEDGSEEGTQRGYDYGYGVGYNEGYTNGENVSQSIQLTNPISAFLQPVHEFMNTKFFGNLSYASLFNVVLFVVVALIFLKMFSGG